MNYIFQSGNTLLNICKQSNIKISQAVVQRETQLTHATKEEINSQMQKSWEVMKDSVKEGLNNHSNACKGKLIGGESTKLKRLRDNKNNICGSLISKTVNYAMAVPEVNASMGVIVAAPTAGSSGVLPGVFTALQEEYNLKDEEIVDALYVSGAVGIIISRNATVAGAEGGCQAEIGSAAAMAAAGVCSLFGGTNEQCLDAASYTIANMLGLVCDPIAGLVEFPCQSRNASGATNALIAAEITLSGITSCIPFDEMVQCMYDVGQRIPVELKETALGGVAATPTACSLCKKIGITIDGLA